jgi:hypothetical protein
METNKIVRCNSIGCNEECQKCGASKSHDESQCEPCPLNERAKCVPVIITNLFEGNNVLITPFNANKDDNIINRRLALFKRRVFIFDTSRADEKYFRTRIQNYLMGRDKGSLSKTCWDMIWIRNNEGITSKYLYFNERAQKLYLDHDFFEWAKLTCQLMNEQFKLIEANNETDS